MKLYLEIAFRGVGACFFIDSDDKTVGVEAIDASNWRWKFDLLIEGTKELVRDYKTTYLHVVRGNELASFEPAAAQRSQQTAVAISSPWLN